MHAKTSFPEIPKSKFIMFRCLVSMAHADGILCDREKEYMRTLLDGHRLSLVQKQTIEDDFVSPAHMHLLVKMIDEPVYRSQVVYFAHVMAHKDGVLHPNEEFMLGKLRDYMLDQADLQSLRPHVRDVLARTMDRHDIDSGEPTQREKAWFGYFMEGLAILRYFM